MDYISLSNEVFEGRNNAYVLADGEDVALVDTGIATDAVRRQFREGLADRNLSFADVDAVVLTHFHPDHSELAGEIQAESDATVYVHEADAPLVTHESDAAEAYESLRHRRFREWGIPEQKREELFAFFESVSGVTGEPADVTPIEDGDVLEVGGRTLRTIHAPGHAAGLCCFEIDEGREVFVGDAVLPFYTPNVGGADVRVDRPLERYLETLRRLADENYERFWPGHRDPIDDPTGRVLSIIEHHRERTERILELLDAHGPSDAWTVSNHLFGDLEGVHIMHGPGEAYAHLDHLEHAGVVERDEVGRYHLLEEEVDIDAVVGKAA